MLTQPVMKEKEIVELFLKQDISRMKGQVIGLIGTLGAGKTTLVKKLLKSIEAGFDSQVQSPTFNICNVYSSAKLEVHHFDLYRIESEDELYEIEIWESIENSTNLIFIEWIDQFPELISKCDKVISISFDVTGQRVYHLDKN